MEFILSIPRVGNEHSKIHGQYDPTARFCHAPGSTGGEVLALVDRHLPSLPQLGAPRFPSIRVGEKLSGDSRLGTAPDDMVCWGTPACDGTE